MHPFIDPAEGFNVDLVDFWWKNLNRYPMLARLALDVMTAQATSVPCEQLFAESGLVVNKKRTLLSAESVQAVLCSESWRKKAVGGVNDVALSYSSVEPVVVVEEENQDGMSRHDGSNDKSTPTIAPNRIGRDYSNWNGYENTRVFADYIRHQPYLLDPSRDITTFIPLCLLKPCIWYIHHFADDELTPCELPIPCFETIWSDQIDPKSHSIRISYVLAELSSSEPL
ncbi:hypothetical protein P9112_005257 [Eukaryota sp. TZLM1-RC]